MTTESQIQANRKNAIKSTGPRTAEGKARASKNSIRHGILSVVHFANAEEKRRFSDAYSGLVDALKPEGVLEDLIVERIALNHWRLARLIKIERGLFTAFDYNNVLSNDLGNVSESLAMRFANRTVEFATLSRYEVALERSILRNLHELERLQARRSGTLVPPPISIDITGLKE